VRVAGLRDRLGGWVTLQMLAAFAVFGSLPFWIEAVGLYRYLGIEILVFAAFALGYNLLLGYTGLPSFGHGAYFGIGAYAFGLFQLNVWPNLWACLLASVLATALAAALVGCFIAHRRGIYFALMTIAFGQVFWTIAIKAHAITGGEDGLLKIARLPVELGFARIAIVDNRALYWFVFAVFVVLVLALWRLIHSPFGRVLQAIKQNETRAAFVGYNVWLYKWLSFVLSAAVSGLAGGLFALAQMSAFPDVMSLHYSGYVVMMTLVGGGFVSFWGPVIGATLFLLARDVIGAMTQAWMLWFGLLFMLLVLFKPEGVAGLWQDLRGRPRGERPAGGLLAMLRR